MRIVIDRHQQSDGTFIEQCVNTERSAWNKVTAPAIQAAPMDFIDFINHLHTTPALVPGTNWDDITNHPLYPGKTRLQAFAGEIVRLNDAAARAVLGV